MLTRYGECPCCGDFCYPEIYDQDESTVWEYCACECGAWFDYKHELHDWNSGESHLKIYEPINIECPEPEPEPEPEPLKRGDYVTVTEPVMLDDCIITPDELAKIHNLKVSYEHWQKWESALARTGDEFRVLGISGISGNIVHIDFHGKSVEVARELVIAIDSNDLRPINYPEYYDRKLL